MEHSRLENKDISHHANMSIVRLVTVTQLELYLSVKSGQQVIGVKLDPLKADWEEDAVKA